MVPWGTQPDHTECDPVGGVDDALKEMVSLGLALSDKVHFRKKTETIDVFLTERLLSVQCRTNCCPEPKIGGFQVDLGKSEQCSDYVEQRARELGVPDKGRSRVPVEVPELHWDDKQRLYCIKTLTGVWHHEGKEDISDLLSESGLDRRSNGDEPSQINKALIDIRQQKNVSQMIALAGYQEGVHVFEGRSVLVPYGFKLIEPSPVVDSNSFPHVWAVLTGLLVEKKEDKQKETEEEKDKRYEPLRCFLAHLKSSYISLRSGQRDGSLAVFICGPIDCGKSMMVTTIVGPILGGRVALAHNYISGDSKFNDELIEKETWLLDDIDPAADHAARKRFGSLVKQSVAANSVACHGKNKAQISLPLFRRLFCCFNDDDLETLPPLRDSLNDKYQLLRAYKFEMPKGCLKLPTKPDRPEFAEKIRSELPAFLAYLLNYDLSAYADRRFGARPYKDPEFLAEHKEAEGLDADYETLCSCLFDKSGRSADQIQLTTGELWTRLMSGLYEGLSSRTWRNKNSLGMSVKALSKSDDYSDFVKKIGVKNGYSIWSILRKPVPEKSKKSVRPVRPQWDLKIRSH